MPGMPGTQWGCPGQRCSLLGCSVLEGMFGTRCPHPGCYQDARWGCLVPGGSALGHPIPERMLHIGMPMLCSFNVVQGCPMLGVVGSDTRHTRCLVPGEGCPILGTGMLSAQGKCSVPGCPVPREMLGNGMPGARGMHGTRIPDPRTVSAWGPHGTGTPSAQGRHPTPGGMLGSGTPCPAAAGNGTHGGTGGSSCRLPRRSPRRGRTRCGARGAGARSDARCSVPPPAWARAALRGRAGGPG